MSLYYFVLLYAVVLAHPCNHNSSFDGLIFYHTITLWDHTNRALSSQRVIVENVIGLLKRFKIISDRYRNRRKRFSLRFNLIAAIHNFELLI